MIDKSHFKVQVDDSINDKTYVKLEFEYDSDTELKFPIHKNINKIINISKDELFTKPILSVISVSGFISKIDFSESNITDSILIDDKVFLIKSDYGGDYDKNYQYAKNIWENKIQTKINKKQDFIKQCLINGKKSRKLRGDGSSLSSQIGFYLHTNTKEFPNNSKHIFISAFTNGRINILGTIDPTLEEAYYYAQIIASKFQIVLQTKPYVSKLFATMHKYKFEVNYPMKILFKKLYPYLITLKELTKNKEIDIHPIVLIRSVDYNQDKDPAKITISVKIVNIQDDFPSDGIISKKERNISIKCFEGNKVNIDGYTPYNYMKLVYNWLLDIYYKVLVKDIELEFSSKYDFTTISGSNFDENNELLN